MELEGKQKRALLIGGLIGAILGAGAAYLMATAPAQVAEGEEEVEPLSATELIALTSAAASLLRRVDDMRRRL